MQPDVKPIDIADASYCLGDYYRALEHYFPLLRGLERTLGTEHLDTAAMYYNIGATYDRMGWRSYALNYYDKALAIRERSLGPSHPDTVLIYKNKAHIYGRSSYGYMLWNCEDDLSYAMSDMGHYFSFDDICHDPYEKAMVFYRKAIAYYESCAPKDEASLQEIELAIHTMKVKKAAENHMALDNYLKVLKIRERLNGMDSVRVAEILYCIGLVYSNMDDSVKAQEYYQRSLEIFRKAYGEEHYCVRSVRNRMELINK